jgi:hypothetical protein
MRIRHSVTRGCCAFASLAALLAVTNQAQADPFFHDPGPFLYDMGNECVVDYLSPGPGAPHRACLAYCEDPDYPYSCQGLHDWAAACTWQDFSQGWLVAAMDPNTPCPSDEAGGYVATNYDMVESYVSIHCSDGNWYDAGFCHGSEWCVASCPSNISADEVQVWTGVEATTGP